MNINAKRNLYLKTVSVEEAQEKYNKCLEDAGILTPASERISVYEALGRVTFEAVYAKCCSPLFNAAAMDGIAVKSADTKGASLRNPMKLRLGSDYIIVDTGDPVKMPFDAVIMAEDVMETDEQTVLITEAVSGWNHVRPIGEDIVTGEMILPSGHRIRSVDVGALLASGNTRIRVNRQPGVGIIPTGTEIITPYQSPEEGEIIDSNSGMFAAQVEEHNAAAKIYDIVEDNPEKIKAAILNALSENDIVLISAGSSAGTEDYTAGVLSELGQVVVHGVSMKPGKPVILAVVQGKPVIGLPGYPVSAYLAFESFVAPVIDTLCGNPKKTGKSLWAYLSKRTVSSLKHREYVRIRLGKVGDKFVATPLARGAGSAMSLVQSDGFLVIPQNCEGYQEGEKVEVMLYKDMKEIEGTLVAIGSHDMLMDIVSDMLSKKYPQFSLSSAHVGSMAGLLALSRGETVIAPTHLLDEETGIYNIAYLKKIFKEDICLIKGVERIQGIMVKKGNPLGICSVEDLTKGRFVNRQKGAGTRVLLDFLLKTAGVDPDAIDGYDKEAATHTAVAASVAGSEIDCGMGILPAAKAFDLDFVEIGVEEYDFAVRESDLSLPYVKAFLDILTSEEFKEKLTQIGGYGFARTGEIIRL